MITSVSFHEDIENGDSLGYELNLPSIKGKTFRFEKFLNVIVGKNGSGKTSLLNVIRKLTFCNRKPYSSIGDRSHDIFRVEGEYKKGYWGAVDLRMDFGKSVFNLNKSAEVADSEVQDSVLNFVNRWEKNCHSEGETLFGDVNQLVGLLMNNGEEAGDRARDFDHRVTMWLKSEKERCQSENHKRMFDDILAYNVRNNTPDNGFTVLFDEPDKGLDVFYAQQILEFLRDCYTFQQCDLQYIAVLHNVAIIKALMESGAPVNFIEMTPGYLDAVRDFGKGK